VTGRTYNRAGAYIEGDMGMGLSCCTREDVNGCLIAGLQGKPTNCAKLAKLAGLLGASEGLDASSVVSMSTIHLRRFYGSAVAGVCRPLWQA